jgi:hypothetical protein
VIEWIFCTRDVSLEKLGSRVLFKYLRNVPARIRDRRDVVFWTGEEILYWYLAKTATSNPA